MGKDIVKDVIDFFRQFYDIPALTVYLFIKPELSVYKYTIDSRGTLRIRWFMS